MVPLDGRNDEGFHLPVVVRQARSKGIDDSLHQSPVVDEPEDLKDVSKASQ